MGAPSQKPTQSSSFGPSTMTEAVADAWQILTPAERKQAIRLGCLSIVAAAAESLGIGAVIPFLAVVTSPDGLTSSRFGEWMSILGLRSQSEQTVAAAGLLVFAFAAKAAFMAFVCWCQGRFVHGTIASIGARLYRGFLKQPWSEHLGRNSSEMIHAISVETTRAADAIVSMLLVLTESLVLTALIAIILWVEPLGTLAVIALTAVAAWLLQAVSARRLARWAVERQQNEVARIKEVQHGLGGAREVRMFAAEGVFFSRYLVHAEALSRIFARQHFVHGLPRLWFEFLAIFAIGLVVSAMAVQGRYAEGIVPALGVFAAAGFRMLPCVMRIVTGCHMIKFQGPAVRSLALELRSIERLNEMPGGTPEASNAQIEFDRVSVRGLSYRYRGSQSDALSGIDMVIPAGSKVGIIGESGSGKSTLVDVLLGLLTPTAGSISIGDMDIARAQSSWPSVIGYVPQSIFLLDDTIAQNVAFGVPPERIDESRVRAALRDAQLLEFVDALPEGIRSVVGERGARLSGGQRQRIGIARALYRNPKVLVLDEATSALDIPTESEFMKTVFALDRTRTVIIVAHRLETVARCDRLFRISAGRIADQGTYTEVVERGLR